MELFTVWTNTDGDQETDRFYEVVKSRTKGLHMSRRGFRFTFRQLDNKVAWTCKGTESNSAFESFLPCVYSIMSSAIADYIIEVKEWGLLNLILTKACSLLEKEDTEQIRSMIRSLLNDDGPRGRLKRHGKLTTLLEKDFKELRVINLEGLIQFRLHAYKKSLKKSSTMPWKNSGQIGNTKNLWGCLNILFFSGKQSSARTRTSPRRT